MSKAYTIWDKIFDETEGDEAIKKAAAQRAYDNADPTMRDWDIFEHNLQWDKDTDRFNAANQAFQNVSANNQFHFNPDKTTFVNDAEENAKLDSLADYLKNSRDQIDLSGYVANVGNMYPNETLSQERADTIKNALLQRGVDAALIDPSLGKGTGQYDNSFWNPQNRNVTVGSFDAPLQEAYYKAIVNDNGNVSSQESKINNQNTAIKDPDEAILYEAINDTNEAIKQREEEPNPQHYKEAKRKLNNEREAVAELEQDYSAQENDARGIDVTPKRLQPFDPFVSPETYTAIPNAIAEGLSAGSPLLDIFANVPKAMATEMFKHWAKLEKDKNDKVFNEFEPIKNIDDNSESKKNIQNFYDYLHGDEGTRRYTSLFQDELPLDRQDLKNDTSFMDLINDIINGNDTSYTDPSKMNLNDLDSYIYKNQDDEFSDLNKWKILYNDYKNSIDSGYLGRGISMPWLRHTLRSRRNNE